MGYVPGTIAALSTALPLRGSQTLHNHRREHAWVYSLSTYYAPRTVRGCEHTVVNKTEIAFLGLATQTGSQKKKQAKASG